MVAEGRVQTRRKEILKEILFDYRRAYNAGRSKQDKIEGSNQRGDPSIIRKIGKKLRY